MSNYNIIIQLREAGFLEDMLRRGILPVNYDTYIKIYDAVIEELKKPKVQKMTAYQFVADRFGVHIDTVRNAVRWCEL